MTRVVLSVATALSIAVTPLTGAAAACYTPAETTAAQVRLLQSELMVAALACRDSNPEHGMIAEYNNFMRRFGDRLATHSRALQGHFNKHYGKEARRQHDSFITGIANTASKRSMNSATFCDETASVFRDIATTDRLDLERFSASRAHDSGLPVTACGTESAAGTASPRR